MGKMVTDTMDHMDVVSRITVNMHDLEQAQADEDSRDKAIDDTWSTKTKDESPSLESIEKEFDLNLANIRQNGIHYSDYYDLVVFLKDKKSVKIIELKRAINSQRKIIKKEESKFKTGENGIIKLTE